MNLKSTLFLCNNVDLDPNYNYTIDFDNLEAQEAYFDSKVANVLAHTDDYSYIRDNQTLKVFVNVDDIVNVNYMFFNNGNKRYYAFILKKDYVSPTCTSITFKIDVMQSFMFDYTIDESFIDREHQDRYIIESSQLKPVYNTIAENLDYGNEYDETIVNHFNRDFILITSKEPLDKSKTNLTCYASNIDTQVYQYLVQNGRPSHHLKKIIFHRGGVETETEEITSLIPSSNLYEDSRVISVRYLGYVPSFIELRTDEEIPYYVANIEAFSMFIADTDFGTMLNIGLVGNDILKGSKEFLTDNEAFWYHRDFTQKRGNRLYEPKLEVYPYSFKRLYIGGKSNIIKNENIKYRYDLTNLKYGTITLFSSLSVNGTTNGVIVENITGKDNNRVFGTSLNGNLRTDAWQDYLLNNKASVNGGIVVSAVGTLAGLVLGAFTGGVGFAVAGASAISLGTQIAHTLNKQQDIKETPDDIRNATDDLGSLDNSGQILGVGDVTIKDSYKKLLANYFNHYGYKCNDFKKPNVKSRYYFNYIKTIGANIKTNISADYKNEIAEIFNNGITLWHYRSSDTFKGVNNYDYENVEMNLIGGNNG